MRDNHSGTSCQLQLKCIRHFSLIRVRRETLHMRFWHIPGHGQVAASAADAVTLHRRARHMSLRPEALFHVEEQLTLLHWHTTCYLCPLHKHCTLFRAPLTWRLAAQGMRRRPSLTSEHLVYLELSSPGPNINIYQSIIYIYIYIYIYMYVSSMELDFEECYRAFIEGWHAKSPEPQKPTKTSGASEALRPQSAASKTAFPKESSLIGPMQAPAVFILEMPENSKDSEARRTVKTAFFQEISTNDMVSQTLPRLPDFYTFVYVQLCMLKEDPRSRHWRSRASLGLQLP